MATDDKKESGKGLHTFDIFVERVECRLAKFRIEGPSSTEALLAAEAAAKNHDFTSESVSDVEYLITDCKEVKEEEEGQK